MKRAATVTRTTRETSITVTVDLDGQGVGDVQTPIPFLSHMVDQLARHGGLDLTVRATGDVEIDGHHTTEDLAIVLGRAVGEALGDRVGIRRYGEATLPMDEALCQVALDLSGRTYYVDRLGLPKAKLGTFDSRAGGGVLRGLRARGDVQPARAAHRGGQPAPRDRVLVQGAGAGAARGGAGRGHAPAVDQGDADGVSDGGVIAVVDVGLGNLRSVERALRAALVAEGRSPELVRCATTRARCARRRPW